MRLELERKIWVLVGKQRSYNGANRIATRSKRSEVGVRKTPGFLPGFRPISVVLLVLLTQSIPFERKTISQNSHF